MQQSAKLKLCYISNPNSIHTRRWLDWFVKHGHDVYLIADAPVRDTWQDVRIYDLTRRFNLRVLRFILWALWTKQLIKQWQPDILHAHRVSSAGWLGAYSGFHPFVVTPWGSDLLSHPYRSRLAHRLAYFVLGKADLVTTNSQTLNEKAISFGANPQQVKLIQFGVDSVVFHPGWEISELRQQINSGSAMVILSSRAITPIYNIDTIVAAIPPVLQRYPKTIFVFKDYNADRAYKSMLIARIEQLGVTNYVRWAGSAQDQAEIARLNCLADIVVSVPSSDGTPSSVLEAMACGKPVIASDLPSLREWISDGENGLLVPVRSSEALAEAIIDLLRNPQKMADFGSANRALIIQRADYHTEMKKVESYYYSLLERA